MTNPSHTEKDVAEIAAPNWKGAIKASVVMAAVGYFFADDDRLCWLRAVQNVANFWMAYWIVRAIGAALIAHREDRNHLISTPNMPKGES